MHMLHFNSSMAITIILKDGVKVIGIVWIHLMFKIVKSSGASRSHKQEVLYITSLSLFIFCHLYELIFLF
jgi:hypothetical protein